MGQRRIQPVKDNMDKYETYKSLMGKYKLAIKYKFYYEALMIDYALLEDRLRSWLYHIGIVPTRDSIKVSVVSKKNLSSIVDEYKQTDEKSGLGYGSISSKIKILRSLMKWAESVEYGYEDNRYLRSLKSQFETIDIMEMLDTLKSIEEWKEYRNEVVHAMMNKNIESLELGLEKHALNGKLYSDIIAKNLRMFKRGNVVRKSANLNMD